jgi:hypothetical protein
MGTANGGTLCHVGRVVGYILSLTYGFYSQSYNENLLKNDGLIDPIGTGSV